ncbi:MAG: tRNA (guanosine(37)-N1)-methyltransferase TrmD [Alcaligenaceae bacterium]|nr:tRNA (guanosine(37)-N1)-methyltransferase TrmD [Alcaligenaceae bacterium]
MRMDVITLFPEIFSVIRDLGVTGRAHRQEIWQLKTWNPRAYTADVHQTVDDRPYGGGPGMVMLPDPLKMALTDIRQNQQESGALATPVILLSPAGKRFDQGVAQRLADSGGAVFVCGRYEGIDQRFIDHYVTEEISLGDFVLSGGEIAALAMIDAAVRLLPSVLNTAESALQDSFHESLSGLLDSPHYTRPEVFEGASVPEVLLSGHHKNIALWRRQMSLRLTQERRPDLILQARRQGLLSPADEKFLKTLSDK